MSKVWLDAGHGGSDPGAVSGSYIESNMALNTTLAAKNELEKHGIFVGLSRATDVFVDLNERCNMANKFGADLFCSIHYNAGGGNGAEVIHSVFHGTSQSMAQNIENRIVSETGQNSRPTPIYSVMNSRGTDYFCVIREAKMPSVIVEGAFVDSTDVDIVSNIDGQTRMGIAIAHGIMDTLGISVNGSLAPINNNTQPTSGSVLKKGDKSTAVMELQNKLIKLHFDMSADGIFGSITENAVKTFQQEKGLTVDGIVGPRTMEAIDDATVGSGEYLKVTTYQSLVNALGVGKLVVDGLVGPATRATYSKMPILLVGSKGDAVTWLQGIVGVSTDGIFGKDTCEAVKSYQNSHGTADDGIVGPNTYKQLVECCQK